ncbi:MAG: Minf_1886 family protein [Verrucomicrobiota bacterium]
MQKHNFDQIVEEICKSDSTYDAAAYAFVREGLDHTLSKMKRQRQSSEKHVSGPELLDGLRQYTLEEFGPLGRMVLNDWGIQRCRDFGTIVFKLIEFNVLGRNESDTIDDFTEIYTFEEAFETPFRPKKALTQPKKPRARKSKSTSSRKKSTSSSGKSKPSL